MIDCKCIDWPRNITFDQEFNAARIPPDAIFLGTTIINGNKCNGWNYNWSAQGPNKNVTFWVTEDSNGGKEHSNQLHSLRFCSDYLPVRLDETYDNGLWFYSNPYLSPDYHSNWFAYRSYCTAESIQNCGFEV